MEHVHPPSTSTPPPVPPSSSVYPAQHQPYQPQAYTPVQSTGRPNIVKRGLRYLLRRTMYGGVLMGRALAPFRIALFIVVPLLILIGVLTSVLVWDRLAGPPTPVARVESLPPSPEVEAFLEGQRTFDADKMWNSFSSSFKARLMDSGLNIDQLKERAQNERMAGRSYLQPVYVGGVPLKTGGAMYFYLINARGPSIPGDGAISFVFTVDNKGKIISVD